MRIDKPCKDRLHKFHFNIIDTELSGLAVSQKSKGKGGLLQKANNVIDIIIDSPSRVLLTKEEIGSIWGCF